MGTNRRATALWTFNNHRESQFKGHANANPVKPIYNINLVLS